MVELELTHATSSADEYGAALAGRSRAGIESVRQEIRSLPPDEAESRLSEALGSDRAVFPPEVMTRMVRAIQDPWWPAKHPVRAFREILEIRKRPRE